MALLTRAEGREVCTVLERAARRYKAALFYPYRVTRDALSDSVRQGLTAQLEGLLSDTAMETFVEAVSCLVHPEHRVKDHIKAAETLVKAGQLQQARRQIAEMKADCFTQERPRLGRKVRWTLLFLAALCSVYSVRTVQRFS
jgi:hypothetical protein